jgi:hypothetical protein
MGINVIVDYYQDDRPARADEFFLCLRQNLKHPEVEAVWNLGGDASSLPDDIRQHRKYHHERSADRLTFRRAIDFANARLAGKFVGIINLDIYLGLTASGWGEAEQLVRAKDIVLCQARSELNADGTVSRDPGFQRYAFCTAQDGWFFVPPLEVQNINFEVGTLGCDNAFAHRLQAAGKVPLNLGTRLPIIHVDICRGKDAANTLAAHKAEHDQRKATYSSFPEREGWYFVPDFDLICDLETLANDLKLDPLQKYKVKCELMSQVMGVDNERNA